MAKTTVAVSESTRRSDRVQLVVPIEVSGMDLKGESFTEQTQTVIISRHGAALVLGRKLTPGLQLTVRRPLAGKEATFQVIREIGKQGDSHVYGVACVDANVNLWDIEFPPLTEPPKAVGRVLLQCSRCEAREVAHLDDFEMEIFKANRSVTRACKRCATSTPWQPVPSETKAKPALPQTESPAPAAAPAGPAVKNRRKEPRTRLQLSACIRESGSGENVVSTENISRSGLCFRSPKRYAEGTLIDVAVPYEPGAANIFVPARIVHSVELKPGRLFRHGVQYLKVRKA